MSKPTTYEPFPPGEYIQEEMDARDWTQDDLAVVLNVTRQTVNRLLGGKTAITPDMAIALGAGFGTSAEFWMNLQTSFEISRAAHAAERDKEEIEKRAEIYNRFPISNLVKRGWIEKTTAVDELEMRLCRFLDVEAINDPPSFQVAARKSEGGESGAVLAWYARVRQLATTAPATRYENGAEACIKHLQTMIQDSADVRRVPRVLSEYGIRLVFVKHLPKTRIDGVATWVDDMPVIGLSLRFPRIDYFWFTLIHELVHIKYCDQAGVDIDEMTSETNGTSEIEQRANSEAANYLISKDKIDSFIFRVSPQYYQARVIQFAKANKVHPGIVVGQLQKRGELDYRQLKGLQVGVRDMVVNQAVTDGWGTDLRLDD